MVMSGSVNTLQALLRAPDGNPRTPPPPQLAGTIPVMPAVSFFKLKNAHEYRFWRGQRIVQLTKGQVFKATDPGDIAYFRARPDVIVECDVTGTIIGGVGPGQVDPKKAKSFKEYRGKPPQAQGPGMPPPPTVQIGKPNPQQPIEVAKTRVYTAPPTPEVVVTPMIAPSQQPAAPLAPSFPPPPPPEDRKARREYAQRLVGQESNEPMSPIEVAGSDGTIVKKTEVRRS